MGKRRRQAATSNAAQARRANRRKLAMIADWQAHGVGPATVPSGTGTTATGTTGAGPTPSEAGGLSGAVGTTGTASVDTDVSGPGAFFVNFFSDELPQYLKIAAGGLGLIITGLALVYVAGRNTPVAQTASTVANVVPAGRIAKAAGSVATGRKALATERRERKFYQTAYENTEEAREGAAASRRTKVLPRIEGVKGGSGKAYR